MKPTGVSTSSAPQPSKDSGFEAADFTAKEQRELDLKEREVVSNEREVAAKLEELRRSRWLNPTVIGLFAAALGLIGSVVVARINNANTQNVERDRAQSNLVLEAIKTGNDTDKACVNLLFFVRLGLLDDPKQAIKAACSSTSPGRPSLPGPSTDDIQNVEAEGRVLDFDSRAPIEGVRVAIGNNSAATNADGRFQVRTLAGGALSSIPLSLSKDGYKSSVEHASGWSLSMSNQGTFTVTIHVLQVGDVFLHKRQP
jgi:hypothetical protein